jgi:hypothetical protein
VRMIFQALRKLGAHQDCVEAGTHAVAVRMSVEPRNLTHLLHIKMWCRTIPKKENTIGSLPNPTMNPRPRCTCKAIGQTL